MTPLGPAHCLTSPVSRSIIVAWLTARSTAVSRPAEDLPGLPRLAHRVISRQRSKWSLSRAILLQKSKVAGRRIFREITKREAIADSYSVTHISEVACEFNVRR